MTAWSTGGVEGSEISLHDTVMMDAHHDTFVTTHRLYKAKSEPYCELWTLVNNKVSVLLHQWNNVPHECKRLTREIHCVKGIYRSPLYFLLSFSVNFTLLQI